MPQFGWLFDPKRCIECRACEAACKQWNGVQTGVNVRYRVVRVRETGKFPAPRVTALSHACNHCADPICMKACPTKAIWRRDDGIVLIDRDRCVGCTQCKMFCPYDAPQFDEKARKMEKCTMCFDRIDAGMQPACATLCPTEALRWGEWSQIERMGSAEADGFPPPRLTKPAIRFISEGWGK